MNLPPGFEMFETPVTLRGGVRGQHQGHSIEVVTGYDIRSDSWPVHVYVDGEKLDNIAGNTAHSYDAAIDIGVATAQGMVDRIGDGCFQRAVER